MWLKSWGEKKLALVNPFCSERDCGQPKLILENSRDSSWHGTLQLLPGGIFPPAASHINWKIKTFQQQIKPLPAGARESGGSGQEIPVVCAVSSGQLLAVSTERLPALPGPEPPQGMETGQGWQQPNPTQKCSNGPREGGQQPTGSKKCKGETLKCTLKIK